MTGRPAGLRLRCPAKINTRLRVVGRRPDGYHDLDTDFVELALHDVLEVRPADALSLRVEGPGASAVPVGDNLVLRAARVLAERAPASIRGGAFLLEKRIPSAAGLGGGSSDAAGALVLLAALHDLRLPDDVMAALALEVGSDVPYFLRGGHQRGEGRGERLTPLPDLPEQPVLLVRGGPPLSTAAVFREHALTGSLTSRKTSTSLSTGAAFGDADQNDLWDAACRLSPGLPVLRRRIESLLPRARVGLSGSGPTLFALLRPEDDAAAARDTVAAALSDGAEVILTSTARAQPPRSRVEPITG